MDQRREPVTAEAETVETVAYAFTLLAMAKGAGVDSTSALDGTVRALVARYGFTAGTARGVVRLALACHARHAGGSAAVRNYASTHFGFRALS